MTIEDRLTTLEINHKGMQDRLNKMQKELKDEIAQAQRNTISQIVAILGFRDPTKRKGDISTKGKAPDPHGRNLNPYSSRVRNE
ncbi:hypothetical protein GQ457_08G018580 [Hibiscus cannabinus]